MLDGDGALQVVNKLTKRDWLLLYECMRNEFNLQSEALRRYVLHFHTQFLPSSLNVLMDASPQRLPSHPNLLQPSFLSAKHNNLD